MSAVVGLKAETRIFKDVMPVDPVTLVDQADMVRDRDIIRSLSGGMMTPKPRDRDFMPFAGDFKWLESLRAELFQKNASSGSFAPNCRLWPLIIDLRNLRIATWRVKTNKGSRTAGVDGVRFSHLEKCLHEFIPDLHNELRLGHFEVSSVSRRWIPKEKKSELRGLGIPTIVDRIVQAAILQIIEPLFEARFLPSSVGFRKGLGVPEGMPIARRSLPLTSHWWPMPRVNIPEVSTA